MCRSWSHAVADRKQTGNDKVLLIVEGLLKYSTYLLIFYVMTDMRKGGDLRHVTPYIIVALTMTYVVIKRDAAIFQSPLFYALSGYVLVSYLLLPFSLDASVSFTALNRQVLSGLVLFLALSVVVRTEDGLRHTMIFFAVLIAVISLGGYFTFIRHYVNQGELGNLFPDIEALRFTMHYNVFAMVLNILTPFVAAYMLRETKKRELFLFGMVLFIASSAVLLSLSRGGWANMFIVACCFAYFLKGSLLSTKRFIAAAAAILIIVAIIAVVVPTVKGRVQVTGQDIGTLNERTLIWQNSIQAIQHSPLVGWGYGDKIVWNGFPMVLDRASSPTVPEHVRIGSHNTVLHILFHQGVIGFLAFAPVLITGFMLVVRALRQARADHAHQAMVVAVFAIFIGSFFVHSLIEIVQFRFIGIVLGIFAGLRWAKKAPSYEDSEHYA